MPQFPHTTQLIKESSLDAQIEALLFASGSSMKRSALARALACSNEEITTALEHLKLRLAPGGTTLVETDGSVALATSPATAEVVASIRKREFAQDIGDAGLEVVSIVLYKNGASRAAIDYLRGVNSAATIRQLTMRGLIERTPGKAGEGELYRATPALLAHLGVTHVSDLPEYDATLEELATFEAKSTPSESVSDSGENLYDGDDAE